MRQSFLFVLLITTITQNIFSSFNKNPIVYDYLSMCYQWGLRADLNEFIAIHNLDRAKRPLHGAINFKDSVGWTPLRLATYNRDWPTVAILIKFEATLEDRDKSKELAAHENTLDLFQAAKNEGFRLRNERQQAYNAHMQYALGHNAQRNTQPPADPHEQQKNSATLDEECRKLLEPLCAAFRKI